MGVLARQVKRAFPGQYDHVDDETLEAKLQANPIAMAKFQALPAQTKGYDTGPLGEFAVGQVEKTAEELRQGKGLTPTSELAAESDPTKERLSVWDVGVRRPLRALGVESEDTTRTVEGGVLHKGEQFSKASQRLMARGITPSMNPNDPMIQAEIAAMEGETQQKQQTGEQQIGEQMAKVSEAIAARTDLSEEQKGAEVEKNLLSRQRMLYGNDVAGAMSEARRIALMKMRETGDAKQAEAAGTESLKAYMQMFKQRAASSGVSRDAELAAAPYDMVMNNLTDSSTLSRTVLETGIPMAIAYATGGMGLLPRVFWQLAGGTVKGVGLQAAYGDEIDPRGAAIESVTELASIPGADILKGAAKGAGKSTLKALATTPKSALRAALGDVQRGVTGAGVEAVEEGFQSGLSPILEEGRAPEPGEVAAGALLGSVMGPGMPGALQTGESVVGSVLRRYNAQNKPAGLQGAPDVPVTPTSPTGGMRVRTFGAPVGGVVRPGLGGAAAEAAAELIGGGVGAGAAKAVGIPAFLGRAPGAHMAKRLVAGLRTAGQPKRVMQEGVPVELMGAEDYEIETALDPINELMRTQQAQVGMDGTGEFGRPMNEFEMATAMAPLDEAIGAQQEAARAAEAAAATPDPVAQAEAEVKQLALQNKLKQARLKAAQLAKQEAEAQRLAELEAEHPDLPGLVENLSPPKGPLPYAKAVEQARQALGLPPKPVTQVPEPAAAPRRQMVTDEEAAAQIAANDPFQTAENVPAGQVGALLPQEPAQEPGLTLTPNEQAQLLGMIRPEHYPRAQFPMSEEEQAQLLGMIGPQAAPQAPAAAAPAGGVSPGILGAVERAYWADGYSRAQETALKMGLSPDEAARVAGDVEKRALTGQIKQPPLAPAPQEGGPQPPEGVVTAPPGHHVMPDGTVMPDQQMAPEGAPTRKRKDDGITDEEKLNHPVFEEVMRQYEAGTLKSSNGKVIPAGNDAQARAIARSMAAKAIRQEREAQAVQDVADAGTKAGINPEQANAMIDQLVERLKGNVGAIKAHLVKLGATPEMIQGVIDPAIARYKTKQKAGAVPTAAAQPPKEKLGKLETQADKVRGVDITSQDDMLAQMIASVKAQLPPEAAPAPAAAAAPAAPAAAPAGEPTDMVTLYRGSKAPSSAGNFWTTDRARAESYSEGTLESVQVPRTVFEMGRKAASEQGMPTTTDTVLPPEYTKNAKVEQVQAKVEEVTDEGGDLASAVAAAVEHFGGPAASKKAPESAQKPAAASQAKPAESAPKKATEKAPEASAAASQEGVSEAQRTEIREAFHAGNTKKAQELARKYGKGSIGKYKVGDVMDDGKLLIDVEDGVAVTMRPKGGSATGSPKGRAYSVAEDYAKVREEYPEPREGVQGEESKFRMDRAAVETGRMMAESRKPKPTLSARDLKRAQPTPKGEKRQYSATPNKLGFYSQAEKVLADPKTPKKQKGEAWSAYLGNPQRGVTKEEFRWTGLAEYLQANKNESLTREQIAEYLKQNEVQIVEHGMGEAQPPAPAVESSRENAYSVGNQDAYETRQVEWITVVKGTPESPYAPDPKYWYARIPNAQAPEGTGWVTGRTEVFDTRAEALQYALDKWGEAAMKAYKERPTKHQIYQEPGIGRGRPSKYREVRITVPRTREGANTYVRKGHYSEQGVVTSFRVNSRRDTNGRRVLFVEEIQSDAGRYAQKYGMGAGAYDRAQDKYIEARDKLVKYREEHPSSYDRPRTHDERNELARLEDAVADAQQIRDEVTEKAPDVAPFIGTTKEYTDLAVKRLLSIAAEEGYDRVAWTTGKTQARRWDLSKHVDAMEYRGGTLRGFNEDRTVFDEDIPPHKLEGYVGKEYADILRKQGEVLVKSGDKIGGQWAYDYYDKVIPGSFERMSKKMGGGPMVDTTIEFSGQHEVIEGGGEFWIADGEGNPVPRWEDLRDPDDGGRFHPAVPAGRTSWGHKADREFFETRADAEKWAKTLDKEFGYNPADNVVKSIDLTPAMRERIKTEGFPQYQVEPSAQPYRAPRAADVKQNLPKGLADRLTKNDDGSYEISTPRGTIRIEFKEDIQVDLESLESGREGAAEAFERGDISIKGVKYTVGGDAIVEAVNAGVLPHEVGGHVWLDHFASPKQRNFLRNKFEAEAKAKKQDWREVMSDAYSDYHKRKLDNPGWEPKGKVGQFIKSIYDFFHGLYRTWRPTTESIFEGIRTGKEFEKAPVKGADTGLVARGNTSEGDSELISPDYGAGKVMKDTRPFKTTQTEPQLVAGGSAGRNVPVSKAGDPSFTLKATPKEPLRIVMPDGSVKKLPTRGVARLMGVPDDYPLPDNEPLARTILGNGVPPPLMQKVVDPLLTVIDKPKGQKPKGVTLFSGGGVAETMLKDQVEFVGAVEYNKDIADHYRKAHGDHVINDDVQNVDFSQWEGADYLHASPVCKNFSAAKAQKGEVELDIKTAEATARAIEEIGPKVVTVENVPAYMDSDAMKVITDTLSEQGYTYDVKVYDSADYGVPQSRKRIILRAVKDAKLPPGPVKEKRVGWWDAVKDLEMADDKSGLAAWQKDRMHKQGNIKLDEAPEPDQAQAYGKGRKSGIARFDQFESMDDWWEHHKALGFSEDELTDALAAQGGGTPQGSELEGGPQYVVSPEQARGLKMKGQLERTPEVEGMVANTKGATLTDEGIEIDLVRFQKTEQGGAESVRTGVFYLPAGSPKKGSFKNTGKGFGGTLYGGTEKITGKTLLRNPLIVKGATGGKAPEAAYKQLKGKDAMKELDQRVVEVVNVTRPAYEGVDAASRASKHQRAVGEIRNFLQGLGYDINEADYKASEIWEYSRKGNQLRYALQEHAIAMAVREAGYDSVVGFSVKRDGGRRIDEVFDVRESHYPMQDQPADIHSSFEPQYSVGEGPKPLKSSTASMLSKAADVKQARPGVKGVLEQKVDLKPRLVQKSKPQYSASRLNADLDREVKRIDAARAKAPRTWDLYERMLELNAKADDYETILLQLGEAADRGRNLSENDQNFVEGYLKKHSKK